MTSYFQGKKIIKYKFSLRIYTFSEILFIFLFYFTAQKRNIEILKHFTGDLEFIWSQFRGQPVQNTQCNYHHLMPDAFKSLMNQYPF